MIVTEEQKIESQAFYKEALDLLDEAGYPYMLGGAFSLFKHTGIYRDTKDLDIFCKPGDYPKIMKFFGEKGFETVMYDVRWLAKVFKGEYFIDIIFNSVNNICTVDDTWLERATPGEFADHQVKFLSPEELMFCKIFVLNRERYDGADLNHLILKKGKEMDWKWVLVRLDAYWHLLLGQLLNFQFVYPSDFHDIIPKWLFDELISRAQDQYAVPPPFEKVCRGPMIDNTQYQIDVKEWDYKAYTIKTV
jgi:hypothetical protein